MLLYCCNILVDFLLILNKHDVILKSDFIYLLLGMWFCEEDGFVYIQVFFINSWGKPEIREKMNKRSETDDLIKKRGTRFATNYCE